MIRLYCGEYMKLPVALHMMLNPCSHGCYYCFAKLGNLKGTDFNAIYKQLAKLREGDPGKNLTKYMFQQGHSICISNTTDPFAASNADGFKELSEWMTEKKINFSLQTRGGKHFNDVIKKIKPTMVYFSVTSDMDDITKTREPATPLFEERMRMIKEAKEAGHFVYIGINPYVPAWWNNFDGFMNRLIDMNVWHVVLGAMHFTAMQRQCISVGNQERFSKEIANGLAKNCDDHHKLDAMVRYMADSGFNVMENWESNTLDYWDEYYKLDYPFMPTKNALLKELNGAGGGEPVKFTLDYFHKWANVFGEFDSSDFHQYLKSFRRSLYNDGVSENIRTSKELHEIYWDIYGYPTPLRCDDFCYSFKSEDDLELDEKGNHVMVYAPDSESFDYQSKGCELMLS